MTLTVIRQKSTDEGTPGDLTVVETGWTCKTLELPWRNNHAEFSCILPDTYSFTVGHSDHLGRDVLRLEDRHGRTDVLVHNGNYAGATDLGWRTDVLGCTLVGSHYGALTPDGGKQQFAILNSVATLSALLDEIRQGEGPHTITYSWADGCMPADLSDVNAA